MKKQTISCSKKTEPANRFLNVAILATVTLAIVPAAIFGAIRYSQNRAAASAKAAEVEEAAPKRTTAAERRAQRLEARKEKKAQPQKNYPEISMETVEPYYDEFGMDYDAEMAFDGFDMMPPAYMGGPVVMPNPYMGGPGRMPVPNRGNFNEFGRMPGADFGFNNGFGGRRRDF